jgi:hypothetical protein
VAVRLQRLFPLSRDTIDRATLFAGATALSPIVFGPVTALLVATRLSPEVQGYYYTFGSLAALQVLFELGLAQVVTQFASHEWPLLHLDKACEVAGDARALARLSRLARGAVSWYAAAGLAAVLLLGLGGAAFFSATSKPGPAWQEPWALLSLVLGFRMLLLPAYAVIQGCGMVTEFWFFRFVEQVLNGLCIWAAVAGGLGLWAPALALAVGFAWGFLYLVSRFRPFLTSILRFRTSGAAQGLWHEVWPMQWRVAISSISTFIVAQLLVPVLFAAKGPVLAGQMGLTATLCAVLTAASTAWVATKMPTFGHLVRGRRFKELDRLFRRAFCASVMVSVVGAAGIAGLLWGLGVAAPKLAVRVLPLGPACLLLGASIAGVAIIGLASYMRAYREEPVAPVNFASTALILGLAFLLASGHGAAGVAGGYLAVVWLFQLPLTVAVVLRSRRRLRAFGEHEIR